MELCDRFITNAGRPVTPKQGAFHEEGVIRLFRQKKTHKGEDRTTRYPSDIIPPGGVVQLTPDNSNYQVSDIMIRPSTTGGGVQLTPDDTLFLEPLERSRLQGTQSVQRIVSQRINNAMHNEPNSLAPKPSTAIDMTWLYNSRRATQRSRRRAVWMALMYTRVYYI